MPSPLGISMKNDKKPWLRFIGDVHGKQSEYTGIANKATYSIQLGDIGFNYDWIQKHLPSDTHKILGGNHDNYTVVDGKFVEQTPHFLGDFGIYTVPEFGDIFYVRGGNSIDKKYRKEGVNWWPLEEITYSQASQALALYEQVKPNFVITHECPTNLLDYVGMSKEEALNWGIKPSMTANLLQSMFELHQPEWWLFGHHHRDWEMTINGTKFRCLNELSYMDFDKR